MKGDHGKRCIDIYNVGVLNASTVRGNVCVGDALTTCWNLVRATIIDGNVDSDARTNRRPAHKPSAPATMLVGQSAAGQQLGVLAGVTGANRDVGQRLDAVHRADQGAARESTFSAVRALAALGTEGLWRLQWPLFCSLAVLAASAACSASAAAAAKMPTSIEATGAAGQRQSDDAITGIRH